MYIATLICAALLGALLALLRIRSQRAEVALRSLFEPGTEFIGKDIDYMTTKAGPSAFFGSMDHGRDVAQWKAGKLLAEAWFQSGICTEVEVRPRRK